MKYLLFLTVALQIASNANGLPLPAGQIVKYRVPSKFFNQQNETAQESSSSLYNFLSQIHYGGSSLTTVSINTNEIQSEDVSDSNVDSEQKKTTEIKSSDDSEATGNVTDQQMSIIKANDDDLQSLIEKVVKNELEKLANERPEMISVEIIKHESEPLNVVSSSKEPESTTEPQTTVFSETTESENLDNETILPTTTPLAVENSDEITEEVETTTNDLQSNEDKDDDDQISDSLLSAVGDLLSSILGIDNTDEVKSESVDTNKSEVTTQSQQVTTTDEILEGTDSVSEATTTPAGSEGEESGTSEDTNANGDKPTNEVDEKIENLAIAQTSFATENIPEQVTETVSDDSAPEVMEEISLKPEEKPDSIEQRITQVMNLVKGTEGRLALEAIGSALDKTLINKEMKNNVNDLAQIVYGTLRESESDFGLYGDKIEGFSPAIHEDLKNFELGFNDAAVDANNFEHENFLPSLLQ